MKWAMLAVLAACVTNPPPQYSQPGYQQPPPGPAPDPNAPPTEPPHETQPPPPNDGAQGLKPSVPEALPVDPTKPMPATSVGVDAKITAIGDGVFAQIDSRADVFSAGMPNADPERAGVLPTTVTLLPGDGYVTIGGTRGLTGCDTNTPAVGADGGACAGGYTDIATAGNASGIIDHKHSMFLVGVFVGAKPGKPAKVLDFSDNEDFAALAPVLGQTFFIGDGQRTTGHVVQKFTIPKGAVKLYLGFADAFGFQGAPGAYGDNTGAIAATVMQHK